MPFPEPIGTGPDSPGAGNADEERDLVPAARDPITGPVDAEPGALSPGPEDQGGGGISNTDEERDLLPPGESPLGPPAGRQP
jgi:hypothetical protein